MGKLTVNEAGMSGWTHSYDFDFNDLIAIGDTGQRTIGKLKVGDAVEACMLVKVTAAAGSTTVVLDIGVTAADPDEYINGLDADGMTTPVVNHGDAFTGNQSQPVSMHASSEQNILLEVNDASVASLTAGRWIFFWRQLSSSAFTAAPGA